MLHYLFTLIFLSDFVFGLLCVVFAPGKNGLVGEFSACRNSFECERLPSVFVNDVLCEKVGFYESCLIKGEAAD